MSNVAKYNIELRTAGQVWETVSIEREDIEALRIEMAVFVGELLRDHAGKIWADQDWRIDVTDEAGLILYVMHISATDTAATGSAASAHGQVQFALPCVEPSSAAGAQAVAKTMEFGASKKPFSYRQAIVVHPSG